MKKLMVFLCAIALVLWAVGSAFAISLGTNITIWDGVSSGSDWYGTQEDQEVEPNCVANQSWDLEGFFLDGTTLTMVGGFDFKNGNLGYDSGDIFIDTNGNAEYGPDNTGTGSGATVVQNNFGYEFALSLDFSTSKYTVHDLTDSSTTVTVWYGQNDESNPWQWNSGGTTNGVLYDFTFFEGLSSSEVGDLVGINHYAMALDLGDFLTPDKINDFTVHFTMECGNDNLMGSAPVPEPSTVMLVGTGLLGMIAFGRKRFNKKA